MANPVKTVPGIDTPVLTIPKPGFVRLTWVNNSSADGASSDDVLVLAIVNTSGVQATKSILTLAKRSDKVYECAVSGNISGDESTMVWAGFMRKSIKDLSPPKTLTVQG